MNRLESAVVTNYRSISNSGVVEFENDLTSLIGENESGKTNFLYALKSLNMGEDYDEDDLCLYNKSEWAGKDSSELRIIKATFDLNSSSSFDSISRIEVSKYYDAHYEVRVKIDEKWTQSIESGGGHAVVSESTTDIIDSLNKMESNQQFKNEEDSIIDTESYYKIRSKLEKFEKNLMGVDLYNKILDSLFEELTEMRAESNNNHATNAINEAKSKVNNWREDISDEIEDSKNQVLKSPSRDLPITDVTALELLNEIPHFFIHEGVEKLSDDVRLEDFEHGANRTFSNLLYLAGINIDEIFESNRRGRFRKTKPASAEVSGVVNDNWSQETIELELDVDGKILSVYINDDQGADGVFTRPSERSKGFQYFLSFYLNLTAESEGELKDTILLLDDPGVYLHPSGKRDLLNTLEQLSDTNQVVYTTHSPFLINQDKLSRLRIVDRRTETEGTTINSEFHQNDSDALAPVRAALGAGIADSLFGSNKNVLVEGASDKIFIDAISNYFRRRNRAGISLNPDEISVINVGGADKMPYFARLIDAEGYDYTIVLDADNKGRQRKRQLDNEYDISSDNLLLLSDIVPNIQSFDAEIEDLFDSKFYHNAVLEAYSDIFEDNELNEALDEIPEESIAKYYNRKFGEELQTGFDKTMVAKHVSTIVRRDNCRDETVGEKTISNFSSLFEGVKENLSL